MTRSALTPVRRRPASRHRWGRGLAMTAVSALLVGTVAACGDDTGSGDSASDGGSTTASSSTSSSPSGSPSGSTSASPTDPTAASPSTTSSAPAGDPVPSPVITKAVKPALRDGFPALVPAGVPAGWTVVSATYKPAKGGSWTIELTDANGAAVTLVQRKQALEAFVAGTLGTEMTESGTVDLGEYGTGTWTVYTGGEAAGVDTALVTSIAKTSVAVSGPDQDTAVALAELLLTAEDGGSGSGDG